MTAAGVSLLNYGVGNLGSVRNMFKRLGVATEDISSPEELRSASRVLLPGVGTFDHGMNALERNGWVDAIRQHANSGKPLLGICLGMQLLLEASEEGQQPGLGLIPGRALRFDGDNALRVPHMGWNYAEPRADHPLFGRLDEEARFYFVHSYFPVPAEEYVIATTTYGRPFCSVHGREGLWATQFHPEKSGRPGLKILKNFADYCREASRAQ